MLGLHAATVSLLGLVSLAWTVAVDGIHGDATSTGISLSGGTCSFSNYSLPQGIYGTGLGPANWDGGGKCGSCLQVTGPKGSVTVMVGYSFAASSSSLFSILFFFYFFLSLLATLSTLLRNPPPPANDRNPKQVVDSCPNCPKNRLNLFSDAFAQIASIQDGIVQVEYEPVSCGINAPLTLRTKAGSSKWLYVEAASQPAALATSCPSRFPSRCLNIRHLS